MKYLIAVLMAAVCLNAAAQTSKTVVVNSQNRLSAPTGPVFFTNNGFSQFTYSNLIGLSSSALWRSTLKVPEYDGTNLSVGTTLKSATLTLKNTVADTSGSALSVQDASGNLNLWANYQGRINLVNYDNDYGAVMVLYNYNPSKVNAIAGHYAFGARDDQENLSTINTIYGVLTDPTETSMDSMLQLGFMNAVNAAPAGTYAYQQPNAYVYLSPTGFSLPSIPIVSQDNLVRMFGTLLFANSDWVANTTGSGIEVWRGATTGNTFSQIQSFTSGGAGYSNMILQPYGGYVGIKNTAPSSLLTVGLSGSANGNVDTWALGNGANAGSQLRFMMSVGGGNAASALAAIKPTSYNASYYNQNTLDFYVGSWNNDNDYGAAKMVIDSGGSVAIPLGGLHIGGSAVAANDNLVVDGSITAGTTSGIYSPGNGTTSLSVGDASHSGVVSLYLPNGNRLGYMGYLTNSFYFYGEAGLPFIFDKADVIIKSNVVVEGKLIFTNTVWDDLQIPGHAVKTGGSAPSFGNFIDSSMQAWLFAGNADQQVWFTCQLPHSYKNGTAIHPHVHWTETTTTGAGTNVVWELLYTWSDIGKTFAGGTTILMTNSVVGTNWTHILSEFPEILNTNVTGVSSILNCRLRRLASSNASDTYDGNAAFLQFDFHIQRDSFGSQQEVIK